MRHFFFLELCFRCVHRPRISIWGFVRPLVRLSVGPSVTRSFRFAKIGQKYSTSWLGAWEPGSLGSQMKDLSKFIATRTKLAMRMRKFNGQQPVFNRFLSEWNVNKLHSGQCERFLLLRTTES